MDKFQISRLNGKSNAQVLLEHVQGSKPGRIFTYQELIDVLSEGAGKRYSVHEVQAVVTANQNRLLKEQSRTLYNVRFIGYKVAHANEHHDLAIVRKGKADAQMARGIQILRGVRWDEMDPQARQAHEGALTLMSGLYSQQQAFDKRLHAIEDALRSVTSTSHPE